MRLALLALALVAAIALAGCGGSDAQPRPAATDFAAAASAAVRDLRDGGAVLVDVRTDAEVAQSRAPAAIHLPLA